MLRIIRSIGFVIIDFILEDFYYILSVCFYKGYFIGSLGYIMILMYCLFVAV